MQVGARGADEQGAIFASSLKRSSVDVKKLRVGRGVTGAATCACRPCSLLLTCMPALVSSPSTTCSLSVRKGLHLNEAVVSGYSVYTKRLKGADLLMKISCALSSQEGLHCAYTAISVGMHPAVSNTCLRLGNHGQQATCNAMCRAVRDPEQQRAENHAHLPGRRRAAVSRRRQQVGL